MTSHAPLPANQPSLTAPLLSGRWLREKHKRLCGYKPQQQNKLSLNTASLHARAEQDVCVCEAKPNAITHPLVFNALQQKYIIT